MTAVTASVEQIPGELYLSPMAILVFQHSEHSSIDRLGQTLRDYGHRLRFVQFHHGDTVPPDLDDIDGIVSCGGPQDPTDDSIEWLSDEMALIRQAREIDMPVVGLCLGCQIVARALGGEVGPMGGVGFGWHDVHLTPAGREDAVHNGLPWTMRMPHHHQHEVKQMPDGARLLASSDQCKVQAWALGLRTYGFQYHPEMDFERFDQWISDEPSLLDESGLTREQLRAQSAEHWPTLGRLTMRLFESMALYLMPLDRRYQGLLKDLHH